MTNTLINKGLWFLVAMIFLVSCKKEELKLYEQDPRIYFERGLSEDFTFTNFGEEVTSDTIYIPLRIMGSATDQDRTFDIIVDDSSTAVRGYHFDFGSMVIPANSYAVDLPIYLYRKPGLKDSIADAYLTIGETADFKPGYGDKVRIDPYDRLHYKISINDQLLKPSDWDFSWLFFLGDYSKAKHLFINQVYGSGEWTDLMFPQDMNFLVQTVKFAYYEYKQENGPLIDENGNEVTFP